MSARRDRGIQERVKLDLSDAARWSSLTLPYVFERAGLEPEKEALRFDGRSRTYGELRERSRRVANGLIAQGVEAMDRVAVLSRNCLEFIEIETGIAGARAIMVPLNWRLRAGELRNLLQRSEAVCAFVDADFLDEVESMRSARDLPALRTVIGLPSGGNVDYESFCAEASEELPERGGRLDDPHEIIFTSGTTGDPKGVVWTNGTVLFNGLQQVVDYGLRPSDSTYVGIDLYYIGGRHDFTWALLQQGATVHIKQSSNFDAAEVVDYVADNGITHVLWVPTMLYEILRLPGLDERDTSRLRMIMCGGAPVSRATTERAQAAFPSTDFIQVYGLTEGGGTVTFIPPQYAKEKAGSAGKPSQHVELRILGDDGSEKPANEDGEIVIRAPSVTAGYWDASRELASSIVDGWLHTGDMGYLDEDGFLYVSGRKRDMIISGGMNIFPSEIEAVLRSHPAVLDVAVIGVPDEKWGESVCAVVEGDVEAIDPDELIEHCKKHLAGYKKPKSIRVVSELPRTASGKPKKFVLRREFGGDPLENPAELSSAGSKH